MISLDHNKTMTWKPSEPPEDELLDQPSYGNRALRMQIASNQMLIRVPDESALLKEVCRIAVEVAGYRMAWLGFSEPDGQKRVGSAAQAGFETECLKSVTFVWADEPGDRGLVGTAIRTGKPSIVVENISASGRQRQAVVQPAYQSSIALPLITEGTTIGVLCLYAAEAGAFHSEEIEILKQLADDLAFGLTALRKHAERERATEALQASMARVLRQESTLIALTKLEAVRSGDLMTSVRRLTEAAAKVLGAARVSVWRYQPGRTAIRCIDLFELHQDRHSAGGELAATDYPSYFHALTECDVIVADDAHEDSRTREFLTSHLKPLGITSMLDAPIRLEDRLDGVLCHEHTGPKRQWAADERTFAIAIANLVSLELEALERKQAEEALRQSHHAYATLVNTIDGIVWEADAQTFQFSFVSQKAERLLGYPAERWLADPSFWKDHVHPDDVEQAVDSCVSATREGRDHDFQYRMIAADGRVVWLHDLVTVVVENERVVKLRGIMVDITERKHAEEALRRSEADLKLALDAGRLGDWKWNIATGEIVWSASCKARYGLSSEADIRYERFLEVLHPDDRQRVDASLRRAVETRSGDYEVEKRVVWPDGSVRWKASRARVFCDAAGQPQFMAGVTMDITDRKHADQELALMSFALNHVREAAYLIDADSRFLYVNDESCRMLGYSRDELLGLGVPDSALTIRWSVGSNIGTN